MRDSFYVETEYGTILAADPDGTIVHTRVSSFGCSPLVASMVDGTPTVWLLEVPAVDLSLRLSGSPFRHGRMLAVMPAERDGRLCLTLPESGLTLLAEALEADDRGAVTAGEAPGGFLRGASQEPGGNSAACLVFDQETAGSLLASGKAEDLPLAAAILQVLPIDGVRSAWLRCTDPAVHDHLFPIAQARGAASLQRFGAYTADTMAGDIALHGWTVGTRTYGHPRIVEAGRGRLAIGRYCSLANPTIVLGNHQPASASSYPFMDLWSEWPGSRVGLSDHVAGDVTIGSDVWIGIDAIILPGADIGDGAVIGAGAVVRGRIPPYAVCVGNPATIKRYRFEAGIIARLLSLRWWDWSDAVVSRYIPLLLDTEIERFLSVAEAEFGTSASSPRPAHEAKPRGASLSWLRRISAGRWLSPASTPRLKDARDGP